YFTPFFIALTHSISFSLSIAQRLYTLSTARNPNKCIRNNPSRYLLLSKTTPMLIPKGVHPARAASIAVTIIEPYVHISVSSFLSFAICVHTKRVLNRSGTEYNRRNTISPAPIMIDRRKKVKETRKEI